MCIRDRANAALLLAALAAVVAAFLYLGLDLLALTEVGNLKQMGAYAARFLQPDLSAPHLQACLLYTSRCV